MVEPLVELFVYGFSPALVVWAWLTYARAAKSWSVPLAFSLLSLTSATLSSLLAVLFLLHAPKVKGIWIFDPWANFLGNGVLISLAAIVLAFCGLWKRHPIRWPALLCAVVGFPFWFGVGGSA
jgi:predicted acyltransferase